jgi:CHAT domain-containing protein
MLTILYRIHKSPAREGDMTERRRSPVRRLAPTLVVTGVRLAYLSRVLFIGLLPLAISACQQNARSSVSLEQAREITAQFRGQGVVPPPRTINDITAILDQQKSDPNKTIALREAADSTPPSGAEGAELAAFYQRRGLAARDLGRTRQRIDDLRQSWRLARPSVDRDPFLTRYLQNLAAAEEAIGNWRTAAALLEENLDFIVPRRGQHLNALIQLEIASLRRGDVAGAEKWLDRAVKEVAALPATQAGLIDLYGSVVAAGRGALHMAGGRFADAETAYRDARNGRQRARTFASQWPDPPPPGNLEIALAGLSRSIAVALARQGRLVEAELEARRALLDILRLQGRESPEGAALIACLAQILLEQGRFVDAERLAAAAIDTYIGGGAGAGSWSLGMARAGLAETLLAQGRWADARRTYQELREGLTGDAAAKRTYLDANLGHGIALLQTGDAPRAVQVFRAARDRWGATRGRVTDSRETAESRGFLGAALSASGDLDGALTEFRAALPSLIAAEHRTDFDESAPGRDVRDRLILEAYLGLLDKIRGTVLEARVGDAVTEAFRIAELARGGRSLQRAISASGTRAVVRDTALADLIRHEQDARQQIGGLYQVLTTALSVPTDQQDSQAQQELRGVIERLSKAGAALRLEIERRFPAYVNLVNPRPATVEQARAALNSGEALLAIYVAADRTFVWAVPRQGPVAFASVALRREDLVSIVKDLREALDPKTMTLGEIPHFDVELAHRLYRHLLGPVATGWNGANNLLVVPHGPLGQLPFSLLVSEPARIGTEGPGQALFSSYKSVPWLVRKVAVTQLPSVATLVALRALPAAPKDRRPFVGFGDPWFSPEQALRAQTEQPRRMEVVTADGLPIRGLPLRRRSWPQTTQLDSAELARLPRLPDTADEVRAIAATLKADPIVDVFLGARANEQAVRTMNLADRRVLLFATHGLLPGDLNGLTQPALALSAPQVTGIDGDGLLTLAKILGLRLNADWVVLSACNTAAGDGVGAEAVSGLGRAFFYAGTRALLVSNWPVETTSARALSTDLFRRQAAEPSLTRAEAMRQAMIALMDGPGMVDAAGRTAFSYAHPMFWAPFSVVGDGGGEHAPDH